MSNNRLCLVSMIVLALAFSSRAQSELIEFVFSGEIFDVSGLLDPPWQESEIGDTYTVRYMIDTAARDHDPGFIFGIYDLVSSTFEIGNSSQTVAGSGFLQVENGLLLDSIYFLSGTTPSEPTASIEFNSIEAIESDAIPAALQIDQWPGLAFDMDLPSGGSILGFVDSVSIQSVPCPGTFIVFSIVLGVCSQRRTRR